MWLLACITDPMRTGILVPFSVLASFEKQPHKPPLISASLSIKWMNLLLTMFPNRITGCTRLRIDREAYACGSFKRLAL